MKLLPLLAITFLMFVNISYAQEVIKLDESVTLEGAVEDRKTEIEQAEPKLDIQTEKTIIKDKIDKSAFADTDKESGFAGIEPLAGRVSEFLDYEPRNRFIEKIDVRAGFRGSTIFQSNSKDDYNLRSNYKFHAVEVGANTYLGDGRTRISVSTNLARQVDGAKSFWEKISDLYIMRNVDDVLPFLPGSASITVGQSRAPVGIEGSQSEFTLLTIERSQIARNFGNYRAMGVKLRGSADFYDYNLGAYDSTRYFNEPFKGAEFTGWVNVKPFAKVSDKYGKLTVGSGISTGDRDGSYTVFGAAAGWEYKDLLVNFEYANANGYNSTWYNSANAQGLYSTVAYFVHPKVQLVGRFDMFDPNIYSADDLKTEYTAGINYYVLNQKVKFVLNYIFSTQEQKPSSNKVMLMTQFML